MTKVLMIAAVCVLTASPIAFGQCAFSAAKGKSACGSAAATCSAPVDAGAVEATVSADALAAIIRSKAAVVLDARSGKYDDGRRIPGAKSLASNATDAAVVATVGADKSVLVVTYCSNLKCPASKRLATSLRRLGYTNVLEYPEGIDGWAKAGKTVTQAE